MGDVQNLVNEEAVEKLKHIAKNEVAMFCTYGADRMLAARPMATMAVDDAGTFWFFSDKNSVKNMQLAQNPSVQLMYCIHSRSEHLSITGTATVTRDQKKIDELWNGLAKAWFTEGKEDPNLTVIKVVPNSGHYWDTKHGKMVAFAKIAVGALTGTRADDGVEGTIKL